jgi:hypothetical protein
MRAKARESSFVRANTKAIIRASVGAPGSRKMACAANAGRGKGRRDDRGRGGQGRGTSGTIPRKASEVGACKELEGHIFTIGSGNKGKDGDMMRTTIEKVATYIRSRNQGDIDGTSRIFLPCPSS